jgi:hypothetical protein
MPNPATIERAREDKRAGKAPSTQAGEFVREEFQHIREGKHGARSPQQAIAIGLSKARRAGVKLPTPSRGRVSDRTRRQAQRDSERSRRGVNGVSRTRSRAVSRALKREGAHSASSRAISRQSHAAAGRKTSSERSAAARRAVRTKGQAALSSAARKAAQTRSQRRK